MPADIESIIKRLNIQDPVEAAIARAGAARVASLDAIGREAAINATLFDKSPAVRAAGVFGLEMNEDAAAAAVPPPPVEMDPEMRAVFDRIDAHFNPQPPKKESTT